MNSFGFIVASCLRNEQHQKSLIKCIESLKLYHPQQKIVVVIDFSSDRNLVENVTGIFSGEVSFENDTTLQVPADMLLYFYFKKNHYFDIAVTLQDSMYLHTNFLINSPNPQYLWHFTNHRLHWSKILEPVTDFSQKNNIITHDDLVKYCLNSMVVDESLKKYCMDLYENKQNWSGCFGCLAIMPHSFLVELDEKTDIINIMMKMTNNRLRRAIESIFSIMFQYTIGREIHESYDGLYYDGYYHNNFHGKTVSKECFDRQ